MTEKTSRARSAADDEFSFLADQAASLGQPTPPARRLELPLADGRVLSAVRLGSEPPRVVLLHGAGLNAHTWDRVAIALGVPVLSIDLPGHGDSSWREDADYRPRTLAPDVIEAIETWAEAPVVLAGQSLGGLTAAAVAAARPDLVASLKLVDITPSAAGGSGSTELRRFYEQTDFASREEALERAMAFGLGGSRDDARRGVFLNTRVREDGRVEWKHHFARLAQRTDAVAAPLVDDTSWDDLAAVTAPVTLVRGERGYVDDAAADEFARRVPQAAIVSLDAPHNVQEAAPVALAALLTSRLNTSASDPAERVPFPTQTLRLPDTTAAASGAADDPTADRR
ncbi:alpha/beta hydrolase [Microbacterium sp. NPDC096154]|uniref:alpha/beta fold hydrolase n=1 Tax=Microbacterium sp. NPDC096154 TaxID=3155549 RepID=UPI003332624C